MNNQRQVEIFSAGCPACEPVVQLVRSIACPSCDVHVLNGIKANSVEYGYYGYGYSYYTPDEEDDSTPFMEEVETASTAHKTKS